MASPGKIFGAVGKLFAAQARAAGRVLGQQARAAGRLVEKIAGTAGRSVERAMRKFPSSPIAPLPPGGKPRVFGSSIPTSQIPDAVDRIHSEQARAEDFFDQPEEGPQDKYYSSDLERFLDGVIVHVDSTHVEWVQWIRDVETLYIGYHGGKGIGVIAVYQYLEMTQADAESIYNSGFHSGTKVWDDLRVRGTVFGHQKPYSIIAASNATYQSGFGGYHPKYLQDAKWEQQHANIPASGAIPPEWFEGLGPYEKAWLARAHGGESNIPVDTGGIKPSFKPTGKRQQSQRGKGKNPWWYGG